MVFSLSADPVICFDPVAIGLKDCGGGGCRVPCIDIDGVELAPYTQCAVCTYGRGESNVPTTFGHIADVFVAEPTKIAFVQWAYTGTAAGGNNGTLSCSAETNIGIPMYLAGRTALTSLAT
jgi:hypothetical protein